MKSAPGYWVDVTEDNYNRYTHYGQRECLSEEACEDIRQNFILESDALYSRLMELVFNLEFEE
jgi:hypothetical protein